MYVNNVAYIDRVICSSYRLVLQCLLIEVSVCIDVQIVTDAELFYGSKSVLSGLNCGRRRKTILRTLNAQCSDINVLLNSDVICDPVDLLLTSL